MHLTVQVGEVYHMQSELTRNQSDVCTLSLTSLSVKLFIVKQKLPRNGEQELVIWNNEDTVGSTSGDNISYNEVTTGVK